jgi:2-C-methyl-D-erythritol 4-phosphate cytidylyltransferase
MNSNSSRKKVAVIVAGGVGSRMAAGMPKQFLELNGKPVLVYTLETFLNSFSDLQVTLVLPTDHLLEGKELVEKYFDINRIKFVSGGETRFHSVQNGLQAIHDSSIIFVHDAVRCLLSAQLVQRCFMQAEEMGSAIPAIAATDSLRILQEGESRSLPRDQVRLIQTPQTFQSEILLPAYQVPFQPAFTDEASVVESFGLPIHLIEGEEQNIKITRPVDLVTAAQYLNARM